MTASAQGAGIVVRTGTVADAEVAARLHAESISEGFLAALGPRFLRHLYRRVALSPDAFLLVAEAEGTTTGFIAGALDLKALYRRFLVHDGVRAALSVLPRLLGSWRLAWETLRHGTAGDDPAAQATADTPTAAGTRPARAELLSIAVDPAWRGRHVGSLLVDGFLAELGRRRVADAQVVVGADNNRAIALYTGHGFTAAARFELHRGTESLVMHRSVAGPATP